MTTAGPQSMRVEQVYSERDDEIDCEKECDVLIVDRGDGSESSRDEARVLLYLFRRVASLVGVWLLLHELDHPVLPK
jgi:hypothetical protein